MATSYLRCELLGQCLKAALASEPVLPPYSDYFYIHEHPESEGQNEGADGTRGIWSYDSAYR